MTFVSREDNWPIDRRNSFEMQLNQWSSLLSPHWSSTKILQQKIIWNARHRVTELKQIHRNYSTAFGALIIPSWIEKFIHGPSLACTQVWRVGRMLPPLGATGGARESVPLLYYSGSQSVCHGSLAGESSRFPSREAVNILRYYFSKVSLWIQHIYDHRYVLQIKSSSSSSSSSPPQGAR